MAPAVGTSVMGGRLPSLSSHNGGKMVITIDADPTTLILLMIGVTMLTIIHAYLTNRIKS